MKIIIPKDYCGVPFDSDELISASDFIRIAEKHGIRINENELEFFDKKGLLRPALRIYRPIERVRRVIQDGKEAWVEDLDSAKGEFRYTCGGILRHGKKFRKSIFGKESIDNRDRDWLEGYQHEIPSELPFQAWSNFNERRPEFVETLSEIGTPAFHYYTAMQLLILDRLVAMLTFRLSPNGCLRSDESWLKIGASIYESQVRTIEVLREWSKEQNRLIAIFFSIRLIEKVIVDNVFQWGEDYAKKYGELLIEDLEDHWKSVLSNQLERQTNNILKKHGVTLEKLGLWIEHLTNQGLFNDPNKQAFFWLHKYAPPYFWNSAEGKVCLAKFYYNVAERLSWAYNACVDIPITTESIYKSHSMEFMPSCIICDKGFKPNPNRRGGYKQVTCSERCSRLNKMLITTKKRRKKHEE